MQVKTRFAPSPTGDLHIGGARTALFSWLFARRHGGSFVLRIEDTDRERSTEASTQAILAGMSWLGMDWDEGPFYQTQRFERYQEVIEQLLAQGDAYYCTCSKERLAELREAQMAAKQKPRYDGKCRALGLANTEDAVIRFRNPKEGEVVINDLIRGEIRVQNAELDDLIIARSDGTPTYNLTVVVDDWDMGITHVIRGDDHVNNTPRQMNLLKALNAPLPTYAHVPTILGEDGKRLSKRHGAVSVMQYQQEGILSQALVNYLVRLGWSHGDKEIFSREEMIELFDLGNIQRSPAALNQDKLLWLNQHYMKESAPESLRDLLAEQFALLEVSVDEGPDLLAVFKLQVERAKSLKELAQSSVYFYRAPTEYDEKVAKKQLTETSKPVLSAFLGQVQSIEDWTPENIHAKVHAVAAEFDIKLGKIAQPIRVAMTGNTVSPSIDVTLHLLGKEVVISRLERAIEYI